MATPQLIIDTDIIIDSLRGRGDTLKKALLNFECAITAITLYELSAISHRSSQEETLERLLRMLPALAFDQAAALRAADVWRQLASQGLKIGLPDTLIAGVCLTNNLPLLTRNAEHYGRVPGLTLLSPENLPVVGS